MMENMVLNLALARDFHTPISPNKVTREIKGVPKNDIGYSRQIKISRVNLHSSRFPFLLKISDTEMYVMIQIPLNIKGLYVSYTDKNLTYTIFWDKASLRNIPDRSSSVVSSENLEMNS